MPGWAKLNVESAIMHRITTSILVKKPGEKVIHIQFKPMPIFKGNSGKGLEIAQTVAVQRPDIKTDIDLKEERKDEQEERIRKAEARLLLRKSGDI